MGLAGPQGALLSALVATGLVLALVGGLAWRSALRPGGLRRPLVWRGAWVGLVTLLWVVVNLVSLAWVRADRAQGTEPVRVGVEAYMWGYRLTSSQVPAGVPVAFTLTSADTVHAFGVYNPEGRLLFTVMVMPGMEEKVVYTFPAPGRYTVRCLEYCGLGHGFMTTQFAVSGG